MFEGSEEERAESGVWRARRVWCKIGNVPETQFRDMDRNVLRCWVGEIITNNTVRRVRAEVVREESPPIGG